MSSAVLTERERDASRKRQSRSAAKDLQIPPPVNRTRREAALMDPYSFLSTYLGSQFKTWTPVRREMVSAIFTALRTKTAQAIAAPRGDGKTTITTGVLAYCILTGSVRHAVVVACTAEAANALLENLKALFERNELLLEDFPEVCIPIRDVSVAPARAGGQTVDGVNTFIEWSGDSVIFPTVGDAPSSGAIVRGVGITSSFRGLNIYGQRPDLVIIDDPDDEESAASEAKTEKRLRKINQSIRGLAGEDSDIARVMLCTLINSSCAAAKYTDRTVNPAWNGRRFKMIEKMPDCVGSDNDLWAKYVDMVREDWENGDRFARRAHLFYLDNFNEMNAGGVVGNEHRFYREVLHEAEVPEPPDGRTVPPAYYQREVSTLQQAFNLIADIGLDSFRTEYQNEPPTDEEDAANKLTVGMVRGSHSAYQGRMTGIPAGTVPAGTEMLTAFIDVGDKFLTWEVNGWGPDERRMVIEYGKQATDSVSVVGVPEAVRRALTDIAEHFRKRAYNLTCGLIDSGDGDHTATVYQWVNENGGPWYPSKGDGLYHAPNLPNTKVKSAARWHFSPQQKCSRSLVLMDSDFWKARAHESLRVQPINDSGEQVPKSVRLFGVEPHQHTEFATEVTAEEFRREGGEGFQREKAGWFKVRKANHWFDTHYGNMVARAVGMLLRASASRPQPRYGVLSKGV